MVRRTTICALAAVMAVCVVPQAASRAQITAEKCAVVWLAEVHGKKATEREAVPPKSSSSRPGLRFAESLTVARCRAFHSFDGRAPPRISTAG